MFDFHLHSIFSDGELIPSELVRRAVYNGYKAIAITDHVDFTNVEHVLGALKKLELCDEQEDNEIEVIIGVEITHVPPGKIAKMAKKSKDLGAEMVVVHGETLVEPVERGTNKAAVSNPLVDILAHPGLISVEEAEIALENEVYLEISSRHGHCLANGHVASVSKEMGVKLLLNSDLHSPDDFLTEELATKILAGAGISQEEVKKVMEEIPKELLKRLGR